MNAQAHALLLLIIGKLLALELHILDKKETDEWWVELDAFLEGYYKASKPRQ